MGEVESPSRTCATGAFDLEDASVALLDCDGREAFFLNGDRIDLAALFGLLLGNQDCRSCNNDECKDNLPMGTKHFHGFLQLFILGT